MGRDIPGVIMIFHGEPACFVCAYRHTVIRHVVMQRNDGFRKRLRASALVCPAWALTNDMKR